MPPVAKTGADAWISFYTPKFIAVFYWQLGFLRLIIMIGIFGYVVGYVMLFKGKHLLETPAQGTFSLQLLPPLRRCNPWKQVDCLLNFKAPPELPYCDFFKADASIDSQELPEMVQKPCRYLDELELQKTDGKGIFIPTYAREMFVKRVLDSTSRNSPDKIKEMNRFVYENGTEQHGGVKDEVKPWREYFVADIERFTLLLRHELSVDNAKEVEIYSGADMIGTLIPRSAESTPTKVKCMDEQGCPENVEVYKPPDDPKVQMRKATSGVSEGRHHNLRKSRDLVRGSLMERFLGVVTNTTENLTEINGTEPNVTKNSTAPVYRARAKAQAVLEEEPIDPRVSDIVDVPLVNNAGLILSVKTLLGLADVNMSDPARNDAELGLAQSDDMQHHKAKSLRQCGVLLTVYITYLNADTAQPPHSWRELLDIQRWAGLEIRPWGEKPKPRYELTVEKSSEACVPHRYVTDTSHWRLDHNEKRTVGEFYGLRLEIRQEGVIKSFDAMQCLNVFMTSLSLLALSALVVDYALELLTSWFFKARYKIHQELMKGSRVMIVENFQSESIPPVQLAKGWEGKVIEIQDGTIAIQIDQLQSTVVRIKDQDSSKLEVLEAVSVPMET